jgi:tRNA-splicing ligase RtcB
MRPHPHLSRLDDTRLKIDNPHGIDATLFARDDVPIQPAAVDELLGLLEVRTTVERLAEVQPDAFDGIPDIPQVAVTPDFHKAAGVPVGTVMATEGFVIPQAIGSDINCGMRVHATSLFAHQLDGKLDALETACRRIYFEGGRNIPMTRRQRTSLFTDGLLGLLENIPKEQVAGLWRHFHEQNLEADLDKVEQLGSLHANRVFGLDDFLGPEEGFSRDSQIGSIGGGNHFVEVQKVEKILDGTVAHAWGLKVGQVVVMVHTGSVGVGHLCGGHFKDVIQKLYPAELKHPDNGVFILPLGPRYKTEADTFRDAMHNAANFAFANRLFLALMLKASLEDVLGDVDFPLIYDAPHNLVWRDNHNGKERWIHRKGACPARGIEAMAGTPYQYLGEPVLVPGSMGASSFLLIGQGNAQALLSASHGAGRSLARGEAMKGYDEEFADFLKRFRVVTPVDFRRVDLQGRRDILRKKLDDLKQEAPFAYKGIGPIVQTLEGAGIARPVVELQPIMTVKG